ncbi:MAG: sigma-70 family RNA polymerase sigma factor [Chloroflexota bacterium]
MPLQMLVQTAQTDIVETDLPTSRTASEKGTLPQAAIQALVRRAQAGDTAAFAQLYDLYSRKIHSYLRYHLNGRAELAEDLASDVFLKALEKLHSYQFSGVPFSAWLYRIAHNHLIDYLRALPKKQGVSLDECTGVDDPSAERALDQTLNHQQLAGALEGLTDEQRQVIVYRFMQDRSIADTARLMDKNEDAVKQLQVRALRNMRRSLSVA